MTTNQIKEQREAMTLEVKARKELLKRLSHPTKLLIAAVDKERTQREERVAQIQEYKTEDEIMDAYGYELITDAERQQLLEALETGEQYIEYTTTPASIALSILKDFIKGLEKEVDGFEFELLPIEEQDKRIRAAERFREEQDERRARRRRPHE